MERELDNSEFTAALLHRAAGSRRIAMLIEQLLGEQIVVGPVAVGPGGIATAKAVGSATSVRGSSASKDGRRIVVLADADLRITVRIAGQILRLRATMTNTVRISLRLMHPLTIKVNLEPVRDEDIDLVLAMPVMVSRALQRIGNIDAEVREHTRRYITGVVSSPRAQRLMSIDVATLIDTAWDTGLVLGDLSPENQR